MKLWQEWYKVVRYFQSGCTYQTAYLYWVLILQGFTLSRETEGVTGLIRRGGLRPLLYKRLLHFFNTSQALALDRLTGNWIRVAPQSFSLRIVNGELYRLPPGGGSGALRTGAASQIRRKDKVDGVVPLGQGFPKGSQSVAGRGPGGNQIPHRMPAVETVEGLDSGRVGQTVKRQLLFPLPLSVQKLFPTRYGIRWG